MFSDESLSRVKIAGILLTTGDGALLSPEEIDACRQLPLQKMLIGSHRASQAGCVGCVVKPVDFEQPERLGDRVLTKL